MPGGPHGTNYWLSADGPHWWPLDSRGSQKTYLKSGSYLVLLHPSGLWPKILLILSAILIAELSQPGNTIWTTLSVNLAIPYWSISVSMTVILTALIAGRLLFMRYRLRKLMGANTRTPYVSLSAMLVESAAIYSVNALVFLVSYGVNSSVQNLALPLLGQTQSIAPLLIIL
ncbi:hypothetical protein C8J57DRAFT_1239938 [Mycena rebaudengoi]|nr:hypothetical protein C8J57DRAFT_1239938 [Mycena rebaudengoi]